MTDHGQQHERPDPFEHATGDICSDPWCSDKDVKAADPKPEQHEQGDYDVWGADFGKVGAGPEMSDSLRDRLNRANPPITLNRRTPEDRAAYLEGKLAELIAERGKLRVELDAANAGWAAAAADYLIAAKERDQAEARGYATAVARLRDGKAYLAWRIGQHSGHFIGAGDARHAAAYLEAVGPQRDQKLTEEEVGAGRPENLRERLAWHYGPTDRDPDPGKMWHYGCGQEVLFLDGGHICGCGAQDDEL